MKFSLLTLIAGMLFIGNVCSQASFSNRNDLLGQRDVHSGVPVGIADMNGDGLDDIVVLDDARRLIVQYQTPDLARPFYRYTSPMSIAGGKQNDICIADFNNDGANDIFITGTYDMTKILYGIPYTYTFNRVNKSVVPFFSQGASTGDFNGDGWVDVVVLNDNGLNYTYLNDGTGDLVVEDLIDFVTDPPSDNSGNYGCVFTDFDMDGDSDFYIAKCRQNVNDPTDPRRINALFVNDGNNNYTEEAAKYGLASGYQSWTADFGDIDNDGDQDVFITQHDVISELFENIENDTFINITESAGLNIIGIPLQGMFRDFDNDGLQDLLVTGDRVDYFHNNGDKTFTALPLFGNSVFGTYALGDLNNDGFTDVYASTVTPFNNPDQLNEDILYVNEGNDNHYLSLRLKDVGINTSVIGATATLYGKWGTQIREVRGGEQYGVSNSHAMIFGLGQETEYDSLIIRWPDGSREYYNELFIDQHWLLQRGDCFNMYQKVWDDLDVICGNDSIVISLDVEAEVLWSTGSNADSIIIKSPGLYFASYKDENDCIVNTVPMEVTNDPDTVKPLITYEGPVQLCNRDVVILSLPNAPGYQWSSGETQQSIEVTASGDYFAAVQGYCLVLQSDTIHLDFMVPVAPVTEPDTFLAGETALLVAQGDSIIWYEDNSGTNVIGTGHELMLSDLTETTIVYAENLSPLEGVEFQLGPAEHAGSSKYNGATINGALLFEVIEPVFLLEFTLFTDFAGTRIIEFYKESDLFYSKEVDLEAGDTTITLDLELPTGTYSVTTNIAKNNEVFGMNNPNLWRTFEEVSYPYEIDGFISITNSSYGSEYFYYFYDWKIRTMDRYCPSDLVPVTAFLDTGVGLDDPLVKNDLKLYPNPADGIIHIQLYDSYPVTIEVISSLGNILLTKKLTAPESLYEMDLSEFPSGIYLIRVVQDGKISTGKMNKL